METNIEQKSKGWHNVTRVDSVRHGLAAKGIRTSGRRDRSSEKLRELSEKGELTWEAFQELFPDAEERLQQLFDDGKVDIDGEEADPTMRKRFKETRITYEEDEEQKEISVMPDTTITLLQETN